MTDDNGSETFTKEQVDAMVAEQVAGLKTNNSALLAEKKRLSDVAKKYEGLDPDVARQAIADREERVRKQALEEGNLEVWKKQTVEQHQKELAAEVKKRDKALNALEKRKVSRLTEALAKADVLPDFMDLLVLKGSSSVRLRESDEDWEEYVSDANGNQLVADGSGTPMTMEQFVQQTLRTQYPSAFKGTGSSGGGATRSTGGASGVTRTIASTNSPDFLNDLANVASGKTKVG